MPVNSTFVSIVQASYIYWQISPVNATDQHCLILNMFKYKYDIAIVVLLFIIININITCFHLFAVLPQIKLLVSGMSSLAMVLFLFYSIIIYLITSIIITTTIFIIVLPTLTTISFTILVCG